MLLKRSHDGSSQWQCEREVHASSAKVPEKEKERRATTVPSLVVGSVSA
jgi:hypothetical protein